jgi:hypothetical protein
MSNINQAFNDRVKYVLSCQSDGFDDLVITEPIGWNNDEKEYARNTEYHGIFPKFSNNLKFIEDGADYINFAREVLGINASLKLTKYEKHPRTDRWVRTYWGYLDMSTWNFENEQVQIKFNSGGLEQLIKARESESVEIDRPDTMDGKPMDPLLINEVSFDGRRIFLKSKWEHNDNLNEVTLGVYSDDGNTRSKATGFPLNLVSPSHEQAKSVSGFSNGNDQSGSTGMMILADFDRTRDLTVKGRNIKLKPFIYDGLNTINGSTEWNWAYFKINLTTYQNSIDFDVKERISLLHIGAGTNEGALVYNSNVLNIHNQLLSIPDFEKNITVEQGDSVALEILLEADLKNYASSRARFYVRMTDFDGDLFVEEDSHFEPSKSKFIFTHDLLDRLVEICSSSKNAFYSKFYGRTELGYAENGPGAHVANTHGFWIRNFDKYPLSTETDPNLFKPLTTSLKDAITSCIAVHNVGMGIEEINNKERLRIEPYGYFFNSNVTIRLPNQVKNIKRSEAVDYYASAIQMGYELGGNYSEAQGLDEPNGKSNFTTVIKSVKATFSRISKYRADSYGKEFCRRKPLELDSTLDTQYDEDVWFLDLKKTAANTFVQRKWQDDFEQAPTGIFSPDTADSLRFSPFNMLLNHGWVIAAGLAKYPMDYVRYGSSTANSQLKTKLIGRNEYVENGNIINSELGTPRFVAEWVEFEHECDFDVMQMVQGTTVIQGNEIPNMYGTVEYQVSDGRWERGFLFNLKPNDKGQWKVLKSNR